MVHALRGHLIAWTHLGNDPDDFDEEGNLMGAVAKNSHAMVLVLPLDLNQSWYDRQASTGTQVREQTLNSDEKEGFNPSGEPTSIEQCGLAATRVFRPIGVIQTRAKLL